MGEGTLVSGHRPARGGSRYSGKAAESTARRINSRLIVDAVEKHDNIGGCIPTSQPRMGQPRILAVTRESALAGFAAHELNSGARVDIVVEYQ
jgi:hypothetical protein